MPISDQLETFEFGDQLRYCCPECEFDSYSPHNIAQHWVESHSEPSGPSGPTLFDATDKPIEQTPEIILPWKNPFL